VDGGRSGDSAAANETAGHVPQVTAGHTDTDDQGVALRVLLITESTYPFHFGGVSSWCRNLITGLPAVDFHILALVASPDLAPVFKLPPNVSGLSTLPIWEVRDAREMQAGLGRADATRPTRAPDAQDLADGLGRPLGALVSALFAGESDPSALAQQVHALYEFFLANDFDASMRSDVAWQAFIASAQASFPAAASAAGYGQAPIGVSDALTGLHWLYHWLLPLSGPLPAADVAHATMRRCCRRSRRSSTPARAWCSPSTGCISARSTSARPATTEVCS
jgi:hypothetical protein